MTRWIAMLTALLLAAAGIWSLDQLLQDQAWMTYDHQTDAWETAATGWGLLLRGWPVLLIGLLAGLAVGYIPGVWTGGRAASLDLAEREQDLVKREQRLAGDREQAERWTQKQDLRLAEREDAIETELNAARRARSEAETSIMDAKKRIVAAEARAASAEARRTNAAAAAERRRRKLARQH